MGLAHGDGGVEVACNLLNVDATPMEAVLEAVRRLAAASGVGVGEAYRIGVDPRMLVETATEVARQPHDQM